ncbi:alpha/beta hydrolase family protein [Pseudoduganella namucuonensis]|uniref:Dipeptidyl aminopeptidase/acylaminoacyl peptidase n=1 Tax=Pseudoduganella namucuonensis TaxID=1035707 RepID=A0A1I7KJZ4_9BURK|nr:prolyl oligopeptidase family serine peptidase [Pseudoduganella namucuonensis]SFU97706.1 Dipeptidyl aminopeptidase/acylaminoacyl peptidase [Pseudoduganella namucuonensis]
MNTKLSRPVAAAMLALAALVPAAAQTRAALPPIEDFFGNPEFSAAQLSPSGRYLAAKLANKNGRERLAVVDLASNSVKSVANFSDADVGNFNWISDERLLFDTTDKQLGQGDLRYGPGLYAVNRDGEGFRQLANRSNHFVQTLSAARMLPWHTFMLRQRGAQDSEFAYVSSAKFSGPNEVDYVDLLRLNTKTGHHSTVNRPGDTRGWLLDERGEPRLVTTVEKDQLSIQYRDPETKAWRKLATFNAYTGGKGAFSPLAMGADGTLYVTTHAYKDKAAVHTLDLATGRISEKPLIELEGYDFRGSLIMGNGRLLGVRYTTDGEGTLWFDEGMKAVQAEIDARLSGTINLVSLPARPETPYLLVESYSDVQPRVFMLYDRDKKTLNKVGDSRPQIKPDQMGKQDLVRYDARDGLKIPAWLTLPRGGGGKLPLVVLVHGGPYLRGGHWGWDAEAQFLASRGYAVLEPEFRGSTGFGQAHYRAGWKQWGLKMQDDIADGAKWAIAQGIADPNRVCIAGASYGGYATLMGLVNDPGLYKCGVNWVGVTDIKLMYTGHWTFQSDLPEGWKQYGMPTLVGDLEQDAAQLKATSPLEQAARITQPLLLAYGGADKRVPLYHGTKFRDAVKATNKNVEWVQYDEEGHGWALPRNRVDFWSRVERFLDRNIGPAAAPRADAPANAGQP